MIIMVKQGLDAGDAESCYYSFNPANNKTEFNVTHPHTDGPIEYGNGWFELQ